MTSYEYCFLTLLLLLPLYASGACCMKLKSRCGGSQKDSAQKENLLRRAESILTSANHKGYTPLQFTRKSTSPRYLPLVSREWKNGSNSSYNCTPFPHSLLTKALHMSDFGAQVRAANPGSMLQETFEASRLRQSTAPQKPCLGFSVIQGSGALSL